MGGMHVACCVQLEDSQVYDYLEPLARHPAVTRVWIVRDRIARYAPVTNAEWITTSSATRAGRWARMWRACGELAARPEVAAFVSFNPYPYGRIAAAAARRHGKAWHYGFIGSDWYRDVGGPLGPVLRPDLRRAPFLTVTGEGMRAELSALGVPAERVAVLPHVVDLERHPLGDPERADHDLVYVGKLVARKRVGDLLDALARLRGRGLAPRLLVVGEGPERAALEVRAARLGLGAAARFVGFQADPAPWIRRARVVVVASSEEGFPFALVEGMAAGLVPVASRVGTIPDQLRHDVDALLFPAGDVGALAEALARLLTEPALHERLRARVQALRPGFDLSVATAVWDGFLRRAGAARGAAGGVAA